MNTENNKIIAEFLGYYTVINDSQYPNKPLYVWDFEDFKFHSDWNWLMEVVEKIEGLGNHGFTIYRKTTNINGLPIELANTRKSTKIQAVYNACVEFIKWYNEHNK